MRNHLEILKEIELKLIRENYILESIELQNEILSGSTGNEIIGRCKLLFKTWKTNNKIQTKEITDLILEYSELNLSFWKRLRKSMC
jgi:hypothetical protein